MKNCRLLALALTALLGHAAIAKHQPLEPRAQVAAALKGMGDAANAHDVERHVGYYARIPGVTLIVDGEPFVGWDAIRDKQQQWWNGGNTDVVYQILRPPEILELAPDTMVTTLLLKSRRTLSSGEIREGQFAVSAIWRKRREGWRVVYSHESSSH